MFRQMKDYEPLNYFDPCLYDFIAMAKKECKTCPLCEDPVDKIMEHLQIRGRSRFLSYCSQHSLIASLRLTLKDMCESEICFDEEYYPIARSLAEITVLGTYENRLYTKKSFNHFYKVSVNPALYIRMILADCARLSFSRYKSVS